MVVARPNDDPRWAYRRGAIGKVLEAVLTMLTRKGTAH